jgi:hypothetical protein
MINGDIANTRLRTSSFLTRNPKYQYKFARQVVPSTLWMVTDASQFEIGHVKGDFRSRPPKSPCAVETLENKNK